MINVICILKAITINFNAEFRTEQLVLYIEIRR